MGVLAVVALACSDDGSANTGDAGADGLDSGGATGREDAGGDGLADWLDVPRLEEARELFAGIAERVDGTYCAWLERCEPDYFEAVHGSRTSCDATSRNSFQVATWAEGYARDHVQVDFERLEQCIDMQAQACSASEIDDRFECLSEALTGTLEAGQACLFDVECRPGLYCDADVCRGTCRTASAQGEPCQKSYECLPPLVCLDAGLIEGTSLVAGEDATCQQRVDIDTFEVSQEGEGCSWLTLSVCAAGLACPDGTCVPALQEGEACTIRDTSDSGMFDIAGDPCERGLSCVWAVGERTCRPDVTAEGQSCEEARCAGSLECLDGPDGKVCKLLAPWGSDCGADFDCESDACIEGICRQPWSSAVPGSPFPSIPPAEGPPTRCGIPWGGPDGMSG